MHPIIALWSHPRSMSTAMERVMRERGDLTCFHEPFMYDYYVHRKVREMPHFEAEPDRPLSYEAVRDMLMEEARTRPVFIKDMSYYVMPRIMEDRAFGNVLINAFLIRDPARVVASYAAKRVMVRPDHLGTARQVEFFDREADRLGHAPPVIDSADILRDPPAMLQKLCAAFGIEWDPAMLQWQPGIHATDGIWASHWYDAVAASTGFGAPDKPAAPLSPEAHAVADACRADYAYLAQHKIAA